MVAIVLDEREWGVVECKNMKLWAAIESGQVHLSTNGIVTKIEHTKTAQ